MRAVFAYIGSVIETLRILADRRAVAAVREAQAEDN